MARIDQQPGWVLHRRPWRESSLIIELFSRDHGRVALIARAARSARSPWRGLAEPFAPLSVSWARRGELGTLSGLETSGPRCELSGRSLYCGLYVNELLMRLIERDDPHDGLFDAYERALTGLVDQQEPAALLLRRFELELLTAMGVAPDFNVDALSSKPIRPEGRYHLQPETGLVAVDRPGPAAPATSPPHVFSGHAIQALAAGVSADRQTAREMRELMRVLIDHQLGGRPLASRRLLLSLPRGSSEKPPSGEQS